ncbi:hypothetical protein Bca52824_029110 [Brassica carinata]|uniref:F-box domain-containing protein n=1 Tax=Brassica carinata TaxID=52824 RepID=A0A8X7VDE1_BRACI|nr:hypothetical protein Bca52824_029110 [Brassica carinata]
MRLRLLDLPWDLVVEILSRVPATSLSPLRFTCKRLNDLFNDQDFIRKHLDKAEKQCMVLMLSDLKVYSMNVDHDGVHDNVVDPQASLNFKDFHNSQRRNFPNSHFHCNGLLLCTTGDSRLVVWNPCTGQISWIPIPYSDRYEQKSEFVIGYDNNKNYKIMRIYDFGSHSWRDLDDLILKKGTIIWEGVSLKGNTYWIAYKKYEQDRLLSFDFSTERFKWMSILFPSSGDDCVPRALSVVREEGLSVLYSSIYGHQENIEIWMTTDDNIGQTKDLSWSKFLSVEQGEKNRQKRFSSGMTFFMDEKKKAAVLCDLEYRHNRKRDMVYVVGEDNRFMEITVGETRLQFLRPLINNYVPSLVRIQQGE